MSGEVAFVCVSARTGIPKHAVDRVELRAGHGVVGDAHAGGGHRQVSLLDERDIETMRARGLTLAPGAFGENLVTRGLALDDLGIGSVARRRRRGARGHPDRQGVPHPVRHLRRQRRLHHAAGRRLRPRAARAAR